MTPKPKRLSRPQRWADACQRAEAALEELVEIQQEYSDWQDNLPENLSGSALGEKLQEVVDLDLEGARDTIGEAGGLELPRGFGKD